MRLSARLAKLEGNSPYHTIGELLDALDGAPLDPRKKTNPALIEAMETMQ